MRHLDTSQHGVPFPASQATRSYEFIQLDPSLSICSFFSSPVWDTWACLGTHARVSWRHLGFSMIQVSSWRCMNHIMDEYA